MFSCAKRIGNMYIVSGLRGRTMEIERCHELRSEIWKFSAVQFVISNWLFGLNTAESSANEMTHLSFHSEWSLRR